MTDFFGKAVDLGYKKTKKTVKGVAGAVGDAIDAGIEAGSHPLRTGGNAAEWVKDNPREALMLPSHIHDAMNYVPDKIYDTAENALSSATGHDIQIPGFIRNPQSWVMNMPLKTMGNMYDVLAPPIKEIVTDPMDAIKGTPGQFEDLGKGIASVGPISKDWMQQVQAQLGDFKEDPSLMGTVRVFGSILGGIGIPLDAMKENSGDALYSMATTGQRDEFSTVTDYVANAIPGPLFHNASPTEFLEDHPELNAGVAEAYKNGYNGHTKGRAAWEFVVGKMDKHDRALADIIYDPTTYLMGAGLVADAIKGPAIGANVAGEVGEISKMRRAAAFPFEVLGGVDTAQNKMMELPFKGLGKVDDLFGSPLQKGGAKIGNWALDGPLGKAYNWASRESGNSVKARQQQDIEKLFTLWVSGDVETSQDARNILMSLHGKLHPQISVFKASRKEVQAWLSGPFEQWYREAVNAIDAGLPPPPHPEMPKIAGFDIDPDFMNEITDSLQRMPKDPRGSAAFAEHPQYRQMKTLLERVQKEMSFGHQFDVLRNGPQPNADAVTPPPPIPNGAVVPNGSVIPPSPDAPMGEARHGYENAPGRYRGGSAIDSSGRSYAPKMSHDQIQARRMDLEQELASPGHPPSYYRQQRAELDLLGKEMRYRQGLPLFATGPRPATASPAAAAPAAPRLNGAAPVPPVPRAAAPAGPKPVITDQYMNTRGTKVAGRDWSGMTPGQLYAEVVNERKKVASLQKEVDNSRYHTTAFGALDRAKVKLKELEEEVVIREAEMGVSLQDAVDLGWKDRFASASSSAPAPAAAAPAPAARPTSRDPVNPVATIRTAQGGVDWKAMGFRTDVSGVPYVTDENLARMTDDQLFLLGKEFRPQSAQQQAVVKEMGRRNEVDWTKLKGPPRTPAAAAPAPTDELPEVRLFGNTDPNGPGPAGTINLIGGGGRASAPGDVRLEVEVVRKMLKDYQSAVFRGKPEGIARARAALDDAQRVLKEAREEYNLPTPEGENDDLIQWIVDTYAFLNGDTDTPPVSPLNKPAGATAPTPAEPAGAAPRPDPSVARPGQTLQTGMFGNPPSFEPPAPGPTGVAEMERRAGIAPTPVESEKIVRKPDGSLDWQAMGIPVGPQGAPDVRNAAHRRMSDELLELAAKEDLPRAGLYRKTLEDRQKMAAMADQMEALGRGEAAPTPAAAAPAPPPEVAPTPAAAVPTGPSTAEPGRVIMAMPAKLDNATRTRIVTYINSLPPGTEVIIGDSPGPDAWVRRAVEERGDLKLKIVDSAPHKAKAVAEGKKAGYGYFEREKERWDYARRNGARVAVFTDEVGDLPSHMQGYIDQNNMLTHDEPTTWDEALQTEKHGQHIEEAVAPNVPGPEIATAEYQMYKKALDELLEQRSQMSHVPPEFQQRVRELEIKVQGMRPRSGLAAPMALPKEKEIGPVAGGILDPEELVRQKRLQARKFRENQFPQFDTPTLKKQAAALAKKDPTKSKYMFEEVERRRNMTIGDLDLEHTHLFNHPYLKKKYSRRYSELKQKLDRPEVDPYIAPSESTAGIDEETGRNYQAQREAGYETNQMSGEEGPWKDRDLRPDSTTMIPDDKSGFLAHSTEDGRDYRLQSTESHGWQDENGVWHTRPNVAHDTYATGEKKLALETSLGMSAGLERTAGEFEWSAAKKTAAENYFQRLKSGKPPLKRVVGLTSAKDEIAEIERLAARYPDAEDLEQAVEHYMLEGEAGLDELEDAVPETAAAPDAPIAADDVQPGDIVTSASGMKVRVLEVGPDQIRIETIEDKLGEQLGAVMGERSISRSQLEHLTSTGTVERGAPAPADFRPQQGPLESQYAAGEALGPPAPEPMNGPFESEYVSREPLGPETPREKRNRLSDIYDGLTDKQKASVEAYYDKVLAAVKNGTKMPSKARVLPARFHHDFLDDIEIMASNAVLTGETLTGGQLERYLTGGAKFLGEQDALRGAHEGWEKQVTDFYTQADAIAKTKGYVDADEVLAFAPVDPETGEKIKPNWFWLNRRAMHPAPRFTASSEAARHLRLDELMSSIPYYKRNQTFMNAKVVIADDNYAGWSIEPAMNHNTAISELARQHPDAWPIIQARVRPIAHEIEAIYNSLSQADKAIADAQFAEQVIEEAGNLGIDARFYWTKREGNSVTGVTYRSGTPAALTERVIHAKNMADVETEIQQLIKMGHIMDLRIPPTTQRMVDAQARFAEMVRLNKKMNEVPRLGKPASVRPLQKSHIRLHRADDPKRPNRNIWTVIDENGEALLDDKGKEISFSKKTDAMRKAYEVEDAEKLARDEVISRAEGMPLPQQRGGLARFSAAPDSPTINELTYKYAHPEPVGVDPIEMRNASHVAAGEPEETIVDLNRYAESLVPEDVSVAQARRLLGYTSDTKGMSPAQVIMKDPASGPHAMIEHLYKKGSLETEDAVAFYEYVPGFELNGEKATVAELFQWAHQKADGDMTEMRRLVFGIMGKKSGPQKTGKLLKYWDTYMNVVRESMLMNFSRGLAALFTDMTSNVYVQLLSGDARAAKMTANFAEVGRNAKFAIDNGGGEHSIVGWSMAQYGVEPPAEMMQMVNRDQASQAWSGDTTIVKVIDSIGGKLGLENDAKVMKGARGASSLLASKWIKTLRGVQDQNARLANWWYHMLEKDPAAKGEFFDLMGRRGANMGKDAAEIQSWRDQLGSHFTAQDVKRITGDTSLSQSWAGMIKKMSKESEEEMHKVLFSYQMTNLDDKMRHIFLFHYWQTRAIAWHANMTIRNPYLLSLYAKAWDATNRDMERAGLDDQGKFYWSVIAQGAFRGIVDPMAVLIPFAMLREWDGKGPESNFDKIMRQSNMFLNPLLGAAATAVGLSDKGVDMTGTSASRNMIRGLVDSARAQGYLPEGITGDPVQNVQDAVLRTVNEYLGVFGSDMKDIDWAQTGAHNSIMEILMSEGEKEFGPWSDMTWEQRQEITAAQNALFMEDFSNPRLLDAMHTYQKAQAGEKMLRSVVPGNPDIQYQPEEERNMLAKRGYNSEPGADEDPAVQNAIATSQQINAGSPAAANVVSSQDFYQNLGDPEQTDELRIYNNISFGNMKPGETITIGQHTLTAEQVNELDDQDREVLANKWMNDVPGRSQDIASVRDQRRQFRDQNPTQDAYSRYQAAVSDGDPKQIMAELRDQYPEFAAREKRERDKQIGKGFTGEALDKKMADWLRSIDAYTSITGDKNKLRDAPVVGGDTPYPVVPGGGNYLFGPQAQGQGQDSFSGSSSSSGPSTPMEALTGSYGGGGSSTYAPSSGQPASTGQAPIDQGGSYGRMAQAAQNYSDYKPDIAGATGSQNSNAKDLSQQIGAYLNGFGELTPAVRRYLNWAQRLRAMHYSGDTSVDAYLKAHADVSTMMAS